MGNRLIHNVRVERLSDAELDFHMDVTHDRDLGERGLNFNTNPPSLRRSSAIRVHEQLHRTGVWDAIPHNHEGTFPFDPWTERLRRRLWLWRYRAARLLFRKRTVVNNDAESERATEVKGK